MCEAPILKSQQLVLASSASSRGFALIAVLWVSSLLAFMAASSLSDTRTRVTLATNAVESAKARILANGGIEHAIFRLLLRSDKLGKNNYKFSLGDGQVLISIIDEDGKIDLNEAPIQLIAGLFKAVGVGNHQAQVLAQRVGDFRDRDDHPEPFGAEHAAYETAGLPHGAANRRFRMVDELLNVLGMTKAIYDRTKAYLTVYSGAAGIDPLHAVPMVLRAVPGMTDESLAMISNPPENFNPRLDLPLGVLAVAKDYFIPSRKSVFLIQASGISRGGGQFVREAIVALKGRSKRRAFAIYSWR